MAAHDEYSMISPPSSFSNCPEQPSKLPPYPPPLRTGQVLQPLSVFPGAPGINLQLCFMCVCVSCFVLLLVIPSLICFSFYCKCAFLLFDLLWRQTTILNSVHLYSDQFKFGGLIRLCVWRTRGQSPRAASASAGRCQADLTARAPVVRRWVRTKWLNRISNNVSSCVANCVQPKFSIEVV